MPFAQGAFHSGTPRLPVPPVEEPYIPILTRVSNAGVPTMIDLEKHVAALTRYADDPQECWSVEEDLELMHGYRAAGTPPPTLILIPTASLHE